MVCICKLCETINVNIYFPLGFSKKNFPFIPCNLGLFASISGPLPPLHSSTSSADLVQNPRNVPSNTHSAGMIRMGFCLVMDFDVYNGWNTSQGKKLALWIMYFLAWSFSFSYFVFQMILMNTYVIFPLEFQWDRCYKISENFLECFFLFCFSFTIGLTQLYDKGYTPRTRGLCRHILWTAKQWYLIKWVSFKFLLNVFLSALLHVNSMGARTSYFL